MERLLADLEAAQEAQERAEARAEVAESVRVEHAGVMLVDRLRAGIGSVVALSVGTETLRGHLLDVGEGWLALDRDGVHAVHGVDDLVRAGLRLVPVNAIACVSGLGRPHVAADGSSIGRGWSSVLRAMARSRAPLAWHRLGGQTIVGTIDAVSADHVVLTPARGAASLVLPLAHLAWIDVNASGR